MSTWRAQMFLVREKANPRHLWKVFPYVGMKPYRIEMDWVADRLVDKVTPSKHALWQPLDGSKWIHDDILMMSITQAMALNKEEIEWYERI